MMWLPSRFMKRNARIHLLKLQPARAKAGTNLTGIRPRSFISAAERALMAYSVEKICFEKSSDLICDLSDILYSRYKGMVDRT